MAATSTRKQSLHEYAAFLMDQVDIVDLFEYLGLFNDGNLRVRGGKIIGRCIMPDHPNPDNPTAFCVDIDKKVYICRTKCRSGGNIITLLERLRGYSFKEAIQFLRITWALTPTPHCVRHKDGLPSSRNVKSNRETSVHRSNCRSTGLSMLIRQHRSGYGIKWGKK